MHLFPLGIYLHGSELKSKAEEVTDSKISVLASGVLV